MTESQIHLFVACTSLFVSIVSLAGTIFSIWLKNQIKLEVLQIRLDMSNMRRELASEIDTKYARTDEVQRWFKSIETLIRARSGPGAIPTS